MFVWRIGHCPDPPPAPATLLSSLGYGSTLQPGRWHTIGPQQVVYCGATRALCQLEKRVTSNGANPKNQALMRLEIPEDAPLQDAVTLELIEESWKRDSTMWRGNQSRTRAIGDAWLARGQALGLWVPSAIEPRENNLLINPQHKDFTRIMLTLERQPFRFDPRLFP